ncbi:MAG: hypothetical protein IT285_03570 [Bdellovibrionales bacterium]|nr:hypothetical protein [Bdellovibrionales bacterium]
MFSPKSRWFQELFAFGAACAAVVLLTGTVISHSGEVDSIVRPAGPWAFGGDRAPGILEEPSETPTGPQAELYVEVERRFEEERARADSDRR